MNFIDKKNRLIDLEAFNVNARYLYSALRDMMGATDENVKSALEEGAQELLQDVSKGLESLRGFLPGQESRRDHAPVVTEEIVNS